MNLLHATTLLKSTTHYLSLFQIGYALRGGQNENKKAVLPQGNRAMPQVFFSVEVRQQHSLQVHV